MTAIGTRPMVFEPHNGYGSNDPDGESYPFGYISADGPRFPLFELGTPLDFPQDELRRLAMKMAAANELYAVALRYEAWEAKFAMCDACWKAGPTSVPLELLEELRDIQKERNAATDKALGK